MSIRRGRIAGASFLGIIMLIAASGPALPTPAEPCSALPQRLEALMAIYLQAGDEAIAQSEPGPALEAARASALAGDPAATVTMVGVVLAMKSPAERYSISTIRQICTFADRNAFPLHLVTCAYFNALNPIGNREEKRAILERGLARFAALPEALRQAEGLDRHAEALAACLP